MIGYARGLNSSRPWGTLESRKARIDARESFSVLQSKIAVSIFTYHNTSMSDEWQGTRKYLGVQLKANVTADRSQHGCAGLAWVILKRYLSPPQLFPATARPRQIVESVRNLEFDAASHIGFTG